jgi:hypothetical protein
MLIRRLLSLPQEEWLILTVMITGRSYIKI